jgi:hypothetical protein
MGFWDGEETRTQVQAHREVSNMIFYAMDAPGLLVAEITCLLNACQSSMMQEEIWPWTFCDTLVPYKAVFNIYIITI